jgi:hypothetical protein
MLKWLLSLSYRIWIVGGQSIDSVVSPVMLARVFPDRFSLSHKLAVRYINSMASLDIYT